MHDRPPDPDRGADQAPSSPAAGLFARPRDDGGARCHADIGKGEVTRRGRRKRLRQVHAGPAGAAADRADRGPVSFDGTDLTALSPAALRRMRRRMAMVFQDPYSSLDPRTPWPSVLAEPFRVQGEPLPAGPCPRCWRHGRPAPRWQPAIRTSLSGGQRQRVGIARALALQPGFRGAGRAHGLAGRVDPGADHRASGRSARPLGLTYLFISHDLGLVRYFCDRIVVMYLGAVVEVLPKPPGRAAPPLYPRADAVGFRPRPGAPPRRSRRCRARFPAPLPCRPAAPLPPAARCLRPLPPRKPGAVGRSCPSRRLLPPALKGPLPCPSTS
jgi:ABC-type ATPase involved in cell division